MVCSALAQMFTPPPLLTIIGPSCSFPLPVLVLMGSFCVLPCSLNSDFCWYFEDVMAFFLTISGVLDGVILSDHNRLHVRMFGWLSDVSVGVCNFRKTSFLGFFGVVCLCILSSKVRLWTLSSVCLWSLFVYA